MNFGVGDTTASIVGADWLKIDCKVDGGSFSPCTNAFTANVPGGSHTFAIRATDGAGNVGTATGTVSVKGGHKA